MHLLLDIKYAIVRTYAYTVTGRSHYLHNLYCESCAIAVSKYSTSSVCLSVNTYSSTTTLCVSCRGLALQRLSILFFTSTTISVNRFHKSTKIRNYIHKVKKIFEYDHCHYHRHRALRSCLMLVHMDC